MAEENLDDLKKDEPQQGESRPDKWLKRIRNHPVIATLIVMGTLALSLVTYANTFHEQWAKMLSWVHPPSESGSIQGVTVIPPAPTPAPEYCSKLPPGEFRPECFFPSGATTAADMAYRSALSYVHQNKQSAILRLGSGVYPKCDVWVEPSQGPAVEIAGISNDQTTIRQTCFIVGPMIVTDNRVNAQTNDDSPSADWCRDTITVQGNDGNVISDLTTSEGKIRVKVHNKNFIKNLQASCDPDTSLFRQYIDGMAANPDRLEIFIAATRGKLEKRWKDLDVTSYRKRTNELNTLIEKIKDAKNNPAIETPLLVQLNDMK